LPQLDRDGGNGANKLREGVFELGGEARQNTRCLASLYFGIDGSREGDVGFEVADYFGDVLYDRGKSVYFENGLKYVSVRMVRGLLLLTSLDRCLMIYVKKFPFGAATTKAAWTSTERSKNLMAADVCEFRMLFTWRRLTLILSAQQFRDGCWLL
jgi:hypothetical protein